MAEESLPEESIFLQALELPPAEREPFLDRVCGPDSKLRGDVAALLRAHEKPAHFLDLPDEATATASRPPQSEVPGGVVGSYKLLEQIGEGGFGVVYLAEQTEPVRRKVALKILKPGMDTRQIVARFEAERQALAIMDHPNIAKVFDAGTTCSGRPYFVMELVKGTPITEYCDQNHFTPRQRLELFISVCQAVQHAHQKGIIHRDLKPSNVLVSRHDSIPVVKVIDFGVAKALGQELTDKTLFTGIAQMLGTPLYMSPEQAGMSDLDVDTRSDIYSLGVVLYELLTGTTPFDKKRFRKAAYDEIRRIIREEEPPKPSTRLSELARSSLVGGADPTREAGPTSNLASISGLRQTEPARLTKLVRGELDWIVMKALEKDRNRRYESASGLAMDLRRYLVDEPVQACPPSAGYRFRKFTKRNKLALAFVGLILFFLVLLGSGVGWVAGDRAARRAKAAESADEALTQARAFIKDQNWPEAKAATQRAQGLLTGAGGNELLHRRLQQVFADLAMVEQLEFARLEQASGKAEQFDSWRGARVYADAFRDYGIAVMELQPNEAANLIAESAIHEQLLAALVDWENIITDPSEKQRLAVVLRLADVDPWRQQVFDALANKDWPRLAHMAGRPEALGQSAARLEALGRILAETDIPAAVEFFRGAQRRHPADFWINHFLGLYLTKLKPARLEEAVGFFRVAVALRPQSPGAHLNLGNYLGAQGRWLEAEAEAREAIRLENDFALAHNNLGHALLQRGQLKEAIAECREALRLQNDFASAHINLGRALCKKGNLDEAIAECRAGVRLQKDNAMAHLHLGIVLKAKGLLDEALAEFRHAILLNKEDADAHNDVGAIMLERENLDEAIVEFQKAIRLNKDYAAAHSNLGCAYRAKGKLADAIAEYREAIRLEKDYAPAHANLAADLLEQGNVDEALAECHKALAIDPGFAEAHCTLGIVLRTKHRLDEAVIEFQEALRLNPNDPMFHHSLGVALADKNQVDVAIKEFHEALRLNKILPEVHFSLGIALWNKGKVEEAIAEYREAIGLKKGLTEAQYVRLKDQYVKIHFNLGVALAAQSKLDEAIAEYREVLHIDKDFAAAHCNIGHVFSSQGKFRRAVEEYRVGHDLGKRNAQWKYPSAQWLRDAERLAALDGRLPKILLGEDQAADATERLLLAKLCQHPSKQLNAAAARFYAEAFNADSKLADDLGASHRYNAACAAALAGCGKGKDADQLGDRERSRLRQQALSWLHADLAAMQNQMGEEKVREPLRQKLQHWLEDSDLLGVRDMDALAKFSESEGQDWGKLWAKVKDLSANTPK